MPKLGLDIEERISLSAKELFFEKGYEQVSMKEISQRADMAVGTLYNYFPNKSELYFSILKNSWNDIFEKLDDLLGKNIDEKEKLRIFITLLYEEVVDRKCMGMEVRKTKVLKENASIKLIEKQVKDKIKAIFKKIKIKKEFQADLDLLDKLVYTLLINLTMLVDFYPADKKKNIEYLYGGIVVFFDL